MRSGRSSARFGQRLLGRVGHAHAIAGLLQVMSDEAGDIGIVFDDQDWLRPDDPCRMERTPLQAQQTGSSRRPYRMLLPRPAAR